VRTTRDRWFSRDDYAQLPEGFPAELVRGHLVKEPAPVWWHQWTVLEIAVRLRTLVGSARVLTAPIDVHVDHWNVLQPDVLVLGPEAALEPQAESGPLPVLVVEVLSPATERRDRGTKTRVYVEAGVQEVWLVDPRSGQITVHTASGAASFAPGETARSRVVPGFELSGAELLAGP
jgi:Uma2 family endonuclease